MFWSKKKKEAPVPTVKRAGIEVSAEDAVIVDKLRRNREAMQAMTEEQRITLEIGIFFKELSRFITLITLSQYARSEVVETLQLSYKTHEGIKYDATTGGRIAINLLEAIEKMCKDIDTSYNQVRDIKDFD